MQAVIFMGIQATGKTSFYRERFADTHIRISLDMLRTTQREKILRSGSLTAAVPLTLLLQKAKRVDNLQ